MTNIRLFLRFFDLDFVRKNLLYILFFALIPFGEILFILYLGEKLGKYLVLAGTAATGLIGFFLYYGSVKRLIGRIRIRVARDEFPGDDFLGLAGSVLGSVLLITPGFFTDIMGLLLFLPIIRNAIGKILIRKQEIQLKELYEYLKLYD